MARFVSEAFISELPHSLERKGGVSVDLRRIIIQETINSWLMTGKQMIHIIQTIKDLERKRENDYEKIAKLGGRK